MSPRFVLGRENVPCVADVVNRSLKADCTDFKKQFCTETKESLSVPLNYTVRACSHEPGAVNYPGVMIAPGQALPRVHMMICCPGATLPRVNFIAPGQVHRQLIITNLSGFL